MALARYYDWLSWFQRVTSWVGQGGGYQSLTVHRLLTSADPKVAGGDVVHERIVGAAGRFDLARDGPRQAPRVIDAGCGLGGTIFYLHRRLGGVYDGLTLSSTQRDRAEREAKRRGVSDACRFHLRSYDDDLQSLAPGGADLIIAIESLAHSPHPARSISNLARTLRLGGRLIVVDDVPHERLLRDDGDFAGFREGWNCRAICGHAALLDSMSGAGLTIDADDDLTGLVPLRDPEAVERLATSNRRWRKWAGWTGAAELIDSLYGGLLLERLYRRGLMQYRLVVARRTAASG